MPFTLSDEKAIDVLIWWVEGADGSIDYEEEETVRRVLETMDYSLETFRETFSHIGSLGNDGIEELVEQSIDRSAKRFSDDRKQAVLLLLHHVAACNGGISREQQDKLDRIKKALGA